MLRPNPADRQSSYQELIAQLQAAHSAALARGEELRGRWGWPMRVLVLLGGLFLFAASGFGIFVGVRHFSRRSAEPTAAPEAAMTPAAIVQTQLEATRRELQAGHYAAAEALFRQIAATAPNVQPAAELCAALQLWERSDFAQATAVFQRFTSLKPSAQLAWLNDYKPLAQNPLDDYQL
jgi:hypothetical protein